MSQTVECPYCEAENDMSDALSDGLSSDNTLDWECSECEQEFEVYVEFEPSFSSTKIEYIDCDKCGTETRDIYRKGTVFPFPESLSKHGTEFCQSCWSKAYFEGSEA